MNLVDLPADILREILRRLDGDSLYACLLVSKALRAFLKTYPEFEYRYRLEKQGMVDTSAGQYSYESRIRALKQLTHFWSISELERTPTHIYPIIGECIAYELVAGVFAKTDGSTLTIHWLPSLVTPARQLVRPPIGFYIKDFALDPTQDLIVMIEADRLPDVVPHNRQVNLHVRTLSTNIPHPEAHKPVIQFNIPFNPRGNDLSAVTIQLASDMLSLFFSTGPGSPHLILWDWKTGTVLLNSMSPNSQLPSGTRSFEHLGPRSYAIFSAENNGCIYVYNINYPTKPVVPPYCAAKLMFPALLPGIQLSSLYSHTGPFLGRPRQGTMFTTAPDARVYVVSTRFLNGSLAHATFFIEHSAFMPYMQTNCVTNEPPEVPWDTWSHRKIFVIPVQLSSNWLRYVQGTRVLMPLDAEQWDVVILDFNKNQGPPQDAPASNFEIFREPIAHVMPTKRWPLSFRTSCNSFMIDEDFVLGLETFGNFEEIIRSLELFSMYDIGDVL